MRPEPYSRAVARWGRRVGRRCAVLVAAGLCLAGAAEAGVRRALVDRGLTAVLAGERLYLEVSPLPGESVVGIARRVSSASDAPRQFAKANGNVKLLRADVEYRVPYAMLTASLQVRALRALFPNDRLDDKGWRHKTRGEGLWTIAQWLAGDGTKFAAIRKANGLRDDPAAGTTLLVPRRLLAPALLAAAKDAAARPQTLASRPTGASPAPTGANGRATGARGTAVTASSGDARTAAVATRPRNAVAASTAVQEEQPVKAAAVDPDESEMAAPSSASTPVAVAGVTATGGPEASPAGPIPGRASVTAQPAADTIAALPAITQPVSQVSPPIEAPPAPVLRAAPRTDAETAAWPAGAESSASAPNAPYRLSFGRDAQGDYAVYELRPGEALYSSVVVRFTGRTLAEDVNALAQEVAKRNGIDDVTSIAIGYPVKIPLELLQPEFLPPGHPRRVEYEAALSASNKFRNQVTALDLEGITVVLDAGHGGIDTGASIGGVWESTYVYDIALRVKNLLEQYTAARVVPTTRDGDRFRLEDHDVLSYSRSRAVLTSPAYPIQDTKVGVNLRWYIANSVQRAAVQSGADPERIVFVSIHADSLHPSLHGAMVYIPDAGLSGDAFERSGPEYSARREVRDAPSGDQSRRDRVRSEGLSRELASYLVRAMKADGLGVDPFKPVRERVIRNRKEWVPAVLRYNVVPAKVLVEVCNLGNTEDRAAIQTRAFRQQMAESIVQGIREYYGKSGAGSPPTALAKARR